MSFQTGLILFLLWNTKKAIRIKFKIPSNLRKVHRLFMDANTASYRFWCELAFILNFITFTSNSLETTWRSPPPPPKLIAKKKKVRLILLILLVKI